MTTQQTQYAALVQARKQCSRCDRLVNPSKCCGGKHDGNELGPWSCWQGNLNAPVMVIGQDWGDESVYIKSQGREPPGIPTNDALRTLMETIGIRIGCPQDPKTDRGEAFFTNAVLCLKQGGMQGRVESHWFTNCGEAFLRPLIEIIRPRLVVSLGSRAYGAVQTAFALPRASFRPAVENPEGWQLMDGVRFFPRYHCGSRVQNTHRTLPQQVADWRRMRHFLEPCTWR